MQKGEAAFQLVYKVLTELGLDPLEIDLYALLVAKGPGPVAAMAKELRVSRPSVYKLARKLSEHGLIRFTDRSRPRTFVVESPAVVLEGIRKKGDGCLRLANELAAAAPALLSLFDQTNRPRRVEAFEKDPKQFRRVFSAIFEEEKKEILWLDGSREQFRTAFISADEMLENAKKRAARGTRIKMLSRPGEMRSDMADDEKMLREQRFLNAPLPFAAAFGIWDGKITFWGPGDAVAVFVEDKDIVALMRSIFYMLWETAEPLRYAPKTAA